MKTIMVFDGVCNFCSWSVRFILQNDVTGRILFAPMQGDTGRALLEQNGIDPTNVETFLFIEDGRVYTRSDAALEIAKHLGGWRFLRVLRLVPRGLRDWVYSVVAKNRYRWFGKRDVCFIPTDAQRSRFID